MLSAGEEAKDIVVERTTFKGKDALRFSAHVEKDGKESGELKGVAVISEKAFFIVMVAAHESDPKVAKKIDAILNSFEIKE